MRLEDGPHRPEAFGLGAYRQVWGIHVGSCVSGEATWPELASTDAHAHVGDDPWAGWVCVHRASAALTPKGKPRALLLHELAHVLVNRTGHGEAWRRMVTALGAPREAAKYPPKPPRLRSVPLWSATSSSPSPAAAPPSSTPEPTTTFPSGGSLS